MDHRRDSFITHQALGLKAESWSISVKNISLVLPVIILLICFCSSLRDGRSIRTVSALLLQLVQTSAHNVRHEARRIAKARQQQFAMKRQDSAIGDLSGPFLDDIDLEVCCLKRFLTTKRADRRQ